MRLSFLTHIGTVAYVFVSESNKDSIIIAREKDGWALIAQETLESHKVLKGVLK